MNIIKIGKRGWLRGFGLSLVAAIIWGNTAFAAQQTLRGTATLADGTPLAKGSVTLVDNGGDLPVTVTTSSSGKFTIKVTGLKAPFLLQSTPAGSVSPLFYGYAQGAGIADVDVYTDLILNMILNAAGTTTLAEFTTPSGLPTADQVQSIAPTIQNLILHWLKVNKVSTKKFSFGALNFAANKTKFGKVLRQTCDQVACGGSVFATGSETLVITDGSTTQTIVFSSTIPSSDPAFGGFTADSVTSVLGEVTASLEATASIPVTAGGSSILDGVNALLSQLQTIVNSKGAKLAGGDLTPLFDLGYVHGGNTIDEAIADLATTLRRVKMSNANVKLLNWTATDVADNTQTDVNASWGFDNNGVSTPIVNEIFRCNAGNVCLFYGNQELAQTPGAVELQELTFSASAGAPTPVTALAVSVLAPSGTVDAVTVDDTSHTYYNASALNLLQTVTEKLFPTPGVEADYPLDQFVLSGPLVGPGTPLAVPAPGFTFTINVTPHGGSAVPSTSILVGTAGEPLNLITPSFTGSHGLAAAPIGKSLTVKWALPKSYATSTINLSGTVLEAGCTVAKAVSTASTIPATATSAKITFPSMIANPGDIKELDLNLVIRGVNGENSRVLYTFGGC